MPKKMVKASLLSFKFSYSAKKSESEKDIEYGTSVNSSTTIKEALEKFYKDMSSKNFTSVQIEDIDTEPVYREKNFY